MKSARGARYFDMSLGELRARGGGGRCRLSFRAGRCNSGVRRLGSRACAAGPRMKELERERR